MAAHDPAVAAVHDTAIQRDATIKKRPKWLLPVGGGVLVVGVAAIVFVAAGGHGSQPAKPEAPVVAPKPEAAMPVEHRRPSSTPRQARRHHAQARRHRAKPVDTATEPVDTATKPATKPADATTKPVDSKLVDKTRTTSATITKKPPPKTTPTTVTTTPTTPTTTSATRLGKRTRGKLPF